MENITAAVIDSGVEVGDAFFLGKKIKSVQYINHEFKKCIYDNDTHGTNIIKKLLYESPDTEIISIQILDKKLKGNVEDLCEAVNYCIENDVDIINLSLGFTLKESLEDQEKILGLKYICEKALNAGIVIFAADNNKNGISYPANFDNVIRISSDKEQISYLAVDKIKKNIIFSDSYVCIPDMVKFKIYRGNSFLTPLVAGLY
ncbi:MAG: S8 family serine peptidase, partial [Anaerocolumna sp.]